MPVDQDGNITTTQSVNVKTLHDVITTDGKDVLPTLFGGLVYMPKALGDDNGVKLDAASVIL